MDVDCHAVASQKPSTCTAATLRVFVACCLIGQTGRPFVSDIPNKFGEALRILKAVQEVLGSSLNSKTAGPSQLPPVLLPEFPCGT
jgi:hypothetical protein